MKLPSTVEVADFPSGFSAVHNVAFGSTIFIERDDYRQVADIESRCKIKSDRERGKDVWYNRSLY